MGSCCNNPIRENLSYKTEHQPGRVLTVEYTNIPKRKRKKKVVVYCKALDQHISTYIPSNLGPGILEGGNMYHC